VQTSSPEKVSAKITQIHKFNSPKSFSIVGPLAPSRTSNALL
jgi:hypothetical protein